MAARPGMGATYTVTSNADSGAGTLRAAILAANANPGTDDVAFDLSGSFAITLTNELPIITGPVRIDGASQPGYTKSPLVTLQRSTSAATNGLVLGAPGCTVAAVRVHGFVSGIRADAPACVIHACYFLSNTAAGVYAAAGGTRILDSYFATNEIGIHVADGPTNSILGNFIGVHPLTGAANGNHIGVLLASDRNNVGGTGAGDGNVISGNALSGIEIAAGTSSNSVRGNLIGTDASGTVAVPNDVGIQLYGSDQAIGGVKTGSRNVISGNRKSGIKMFSSTQPLARNKIEGNLIGTDVAGNNAIPNDVGIYLEESACQSNVIGGTLEAQRNVVSGNADIGVLLDLAPNNTIKGNYIGLDVSGRYGLGNGNSGVQVVNAATTQVGGTNVEAGNVISGNGLHGIFLFGSRCGGSVVQQNWIGTTAAGGQAIANQGSGIMVSTARRITIGGIGAGNVISGNREYGIYVDDAGSWGLTVQGNRIGTTPSGQSALGNEYGGIYLNGAPSNQIGGVSAAAGNLIGGNKGNGIVIDGADACSNAVLSNLIGVDADGEDPLPNGDSGLYLLAARRCRVGGDLLVGGGNLISGNGAHGIRMQGASDCELVGNRIGGHIVGAGFGGNARCGLYVSATTSNNFIGGDVWSRANVVAYNGEAGIALYNDTNTVGNRLDFNWIFSNDGLGIDLGDDGPTPNDPFVGGDPDDGANHLQNFPSITNVFVDGPNLRLQGSLRSGLTETYKLNFYGNTRFDPSGYGEGEFILGTTNVFTSPLDTAHFDVAVPAPDPLPDYCAATATHLASGDTSEFSHFAMLDSDGDGMPDGWEQDHFGSPTGGDPAGHGDADDAPNLDEYRADTDPNDDASFLRILEIGNTNIDSGIVTAVVFPSSAYRHYRVEHAEGPELRTNGWTAGAAGYQPGTGGNLTGIDLLPAGTTAVHFRMRARLP